MEVVPDRCFLLNKLGPKVALPCCILDYLSTEALVMRSRAYHIEEREYGVKGVSDYHDALCGTASISTYSLRVVRLRNPD